MPCYTIRQTSVMFDKLAYRPGNVRMLIDALKELGFEVESDPERTNPGLRIRPAGMARRADNTVVYQDGTFEIPSTLENRFSLDRVKEAYARQAIRLHARRNGWLLHEISGTEFELMKR
jgi:hypothetical protein